MLGGERNIVCVLFDKTVLLLYYFRVAWLATQKAMMKDKFFLKLAFERANGWCEFVARQKGYHLLAGFLKISVRNFGGFPLQRPYVIAYRKIWYLQNL